MSKIEKLKAEFEGVEIEWRLHERIRQMFAYVAANEAVRRIIGNNPPPDDTWPELNRAFHKARRDLGLDD